jgi:FxsC-like protein
VPATGTSAKAACITSDANMSCFFFFSYATGNDPDANRHKRQFFGDLEARIAAHRSYDNSAPKVGFLDADMVTGTDWQPELARALQTCRVFVYLQDQAYFNFTERPWCGREWRVFHDRLDEHTGRLPAGAQRPPLMIPVVWQILAKLPDAAGAVQFKSRNLGEVYSQLGLCEMKSRQEFNVAYATLVTNLADHIVETANTHRLEPLHALPDFQGIPNPFGPVAPKPPLRAAEKRGPRFVDFVYVVASRDQFEQSRPLLREKSRRCLDGYDQDGIAGAWRPYYPPIEKRVAAIAETLAYDKDLIPDRIDFGDDLIARLQDSKNKHRIVVLILDPWTVQLPEYYTRMREFGEQNFWNCVVVVPWNEDEETQQQTEILRGVIKELFFGLPPDVVRTQVRSTKEFVRDLGKAFLTAHQKIQAFAQVRRVRGAGPESLPVFSGV